MYKAYNEEDGFEVAWNEACSPPLQKARPFRFSGAFDSELHQGPKLWGGCILKDMVIFKVVFIIII